MLTAWAQAWLGSTSVLGQWPFPEEAKRFLLFSNLVILQYTAVCYQLNAILYIVLTANAGETF